MRTERQVLEIIKESKEIGCQVTHRGGNLQVPDVCLLGWDKNGGECMSYICTEAALEVIETALSEWGWNEVSSPVVQAQLYHAVLLELENERSRHIADGVPFS